MSDFRDLKINDKLTIQVDPDGHLCDSAKWTKKIALYFIQTERIKDNKTIWEITTEFRRKYKTTKKPPKMFHLSDQFWNRLNKRRRGMDSISVPNRPFFLIKLFTPEADTKQHPKAMIKTPPPTISIGEALVKACRISGLPKPNIYIPTR